MEDITRIRCKHNITTNDVVQIIHFYMEQNNYNIKFIDNIDSNTYIYEKYNECYVKLNESKLLEKKHKCDKKDIRYINYEIHEKLHEIINNHYISWIVDHAEDETETLNENTKKTFYELNEKNQAAIVNLANIIYNMNDYSIKEGQLIKKLHI